MFIINSKRRTSKNEDVKKIKSESIRKISMLSYSLPPQGVTAAPAEQLQRAALAVFDSVVMETAPRLSDKNHP